MGEISIKSPSQGLMEAFRDNALERDRPCPMRWWVIWVNNYGHFMFAGTEAEAEERRADKCKWEGAMGRKRPATDEEVRANKAPDSMEWVP